MPVDPDLERLLTKTLQRTDELLERGEVDKDVAKRGVETAAADLDKRFPGHTDWIDARIAEWLRRRAH